MVTDQYLLAATIISGSVIAEIKKNTKKQWQTKTQSTIRESNLFNLRAMHHNATLTNHTDMSSMAKERQRLADNFLEEIVAASSGGHIVGIHLYIGIQR